MRHQDLTLNHRLESWVYANAAARLAATGFVAGDLARIAYQTDTGQYWRLTATTPTWALIGPPNAVFAILQAGPLNPTVTSALAPGVMMGLGVGRTITPTSTGKILVTISGTILNSIAGKIPTCQMQYGTGTPPTNGASGATGTPIGGQAALTGNTPSNASPFSLTALITAAPLGVAHWFDLALWTNAGGTSAVVQVSVTAVEIP